MTRTYENHVTLLIPHILHIKIAILFNNNVGGFGKTSMFTANVYIAFLPITQHYLIFNTIYKIIRCVFLRMARFYRNFCDILIQILTFNNIKYINIFVCRQRVGKIKIFLGLMICNFAFIRTSRLWSHKTKLVVI